MVHPKFIMGGVGPNFSWIANGPGYGAGTWEKPRGQYGVAQLSPWLLFPLDGLNLKKKTISWPALQKIKQFYDNGGKVIATMELPYQSTEFNHDTDVRNTIRAMFDTPVSYPGSSGTYSYPIADASTTYMCSCGLECCIYYGYRGRPERYKSAAFAAAGQIGFSQGHGSDPGF